MTFSAPPPPKFSIPASKIEDSFWHFWVAKSAPLANDRIRSLMKKIYADATFSETHWSFPLIFFPFIYDLKT
jgi:hypothetical protein